MFIKDFEDNLKCAGICQAPDFWFYREFYVGPPEQNCLVSIKS